MESPELPNRDSLTPNESLLACVVFRVLFALSDRTGWRYWPSVQLPDLAHFAPPPLFGRHSLSQ